ncbi:hypothetical protein SCANM63S_02425 [Streptomyces canarius]
MDSVNQLGRFLRARRAVVSPREAGLPDDAPRRTPGLKQEEVARLAGLSEGYYARLEQAREKHPSDQVLQALARVLRLNPDAARYMRALVRDQDRPAPADAEVAAHVMRLIEAWDTTPALVLGSCLDILAGNALGRAMYAPVLPYGNLVRFTFLDRVAARAFYRDWQLIAEAGSPGRGRQRASRRAVPAWTNWWRSCPRTRSSAGCGAVSTCGTRRAT